MRKTFSSLALLTMLCTLVQAQAEFSKSGTEWVVDYLYVRYSQSNWYQFSYHLGKDTTLLNETWKVLYQGKKPVGAFQEAGKKVYYYSFYWPEEITSKKRLFYDFSKEEGDTIYFRAQFGSGSSYIYENKEEAATENEYFASEEVKNVRYEQGRKIFDIGGETWIEGIGSTSSFFDRWWPRETNGSSVSLDLHQVITNSQTVYIQNTVIDSCYQDTFLKEGKKWYVKTTTKKDAYSIYELGAPEIVDQYKMYPITFDGTPMGHLYDVNGTICWREGSYDDLKANIPIYNFSLRKGDTFWLYTAYGVSTEPPAKIQKAQYKVTETDSVYMGKTPIKRLRLGSSMVWLEGIGAVSGPLYTKTYNDYTGFHFYPKWDDVLTCCYVNEDPLYHNPDYQDCMPSSVDEIAQQTGLYEIRGNQLILPCSDACSLELYRPCGELIYRKALPQGSSTVNLEGFPALLIGKLTVKNGKTFHLKIIR